MNVYQEYMFVAPVANSMKLPGCPKIEYGMLGNLVDLFVFLACRFLYVVLPHAAI